MNIALLEQQESIAKQLVTNGCDVDVPDSEGSCLLHKAIERGDEFAATFLIKNSAKVNAVTTTEQISPLHLAASYKYAFGFSLQTRFSISYYLVSIQFVCVFLLYLFKPFQF